MVCASRSRLAEAHLLSRQLPATESNSDCATRIEFPTRTCRSSPRLHSAYTVAMPVAWLLRLGLSTMQSSRHLPIVHGPPDVSDGSESSRARACAGTTASVGVHNAASTSGCLAFDGKLLGAVTRLSPRCGAWGFLLMERAWPS